MALISIPLTKCGKTQLEPNLQVPYSFKLARNNIEVITTAVYLLKAATWLENLICVAVHAVVALRARPRPSIIDTGQFLLV